MEAAVSENIQSAPVEKKRIASRESGIELLRIICMILIICHHFSCHSGFAFPMEELSFNKFWVGTLYAGGKIGVDVFVLISGYFMCKSDKVKSSRIVKLWMQLFVVSILCYLIFLACGRYSFNWQDLLHNLFPITFERAWFVSAFFVLMLLVPVLNLIVKHLTQKRYIIMLIIGGVIWCLIPTIVWDKTYFFSNWEYNSIIWFIYLYLLGGYLKVYGLPKKINNFKGIVFILAALGIFVFFLGVIELFQWIGTSNEFFANNYTYLFEMQTLPVLAISVLLLVGFSKLKMKTSKTINFISSLTFGIYLIHDNFILREWLWKDLVQATNFQNSPWLILYSIGIVLAVFICAGLLELIRQLTLEKLYMIPLGKLCNRIDQKLGASMLDKKITSEELDELKKENK